ncbi:MAG: T9SS type A sorting domain-containing protein [Flavobacterium sp.]|nr:MAG: T9SS type A sorting domain-containing protein [Flavobacterium sp.]
MKNCYIILFVLFSVFGSAQEDAWVYFVNKPNAQSYLDNPLTMLSQRALDRRSAQQIDVNISDVPIYQPYVDAIDAAPGIEVLAKSKWLNAVHVRGSYDDINALPQLFDYVIDIDFADHSLTESRQPTQNLFKPVNKLLDVQANFNYGNSANQIQMLNGQYLHQQNFTGAGKIIAVLDAGFPSVDVTAPFQRLRDNNQILGGYNFVDDNEDFYTRDGHGTMVLSTMGGYVDGQLVGTAPDAGYYLFITEDVDSETPLEESLWVEAAEAADSLGADVITSSLGYFTYDNPAYSYNYSQMNGVVSFASRGASAAFSKGMIVVVSAGNSGNTLNPHIGVPADAVEVLTVGAVNPAGNYASFSSIGPSADGRVKPDVVAQGQSATVANPFGQITTASGTSFSGPIIAGMVASYWQAEPQLKNYEVVLNIKQSASNYTTPNPQIGYGIPDFQQALRTPAFASQAGFSVFPNPFNGPIHIALPEGLESADLTIYDALGQRVSQNHIGGAQSQVDLENLAPGIYFYKIAAANRTQSGKLIKS